MRRRSFISKLFKEAHHPSLYYNFFHMNPEQDLPTLPPTHKWWFWSFLALMKIYAHSWVWSSGVPCWDFFFYQIFFLGWMHLKSEICQVGWEKTMNSISLSFSWTEEREREREREMGIRLASYNLQFVISTHMRKHGVSVLALPNFNHIKFTIYNKP